MKFLVTGGSGFIGSALIRYVINKTDHKVLNIDKLTYAGNPENLSSVDKDARYDFKKMDICDENSLRKVFDSYKPDLVMHLAAESHVDNSINGPEVFIQTNIFGTFNLLNISNEYYKQNNNFAFHHISTDEVYGDLELTDKPFTEGSSYKPSSPYSATKASSDHLVRAWNRTYGLPIFISNCSNNYGPFHYPEKFIPKTIINLLNNKKVPLYGDGKQIRDWLFVDDHAEALLKVATSKKYGETYNIGGNAEVENINVIRTIIRHLVEKGFKTEEELLKLVDYVKDRPGHDKRYSIDNLKIKNDLGWTPKETFDSGISKTIDWYISNKSWIENLQNKDK